MSIKIDGDLRLVMENEVKIAKMAAMGAVAGVAALIKADWRAQIAQAGLGSSLGNTVRSEIYPKGNLSLNAAALIWSKAKKVVGAFETGVEIRAKNGIWLAIPLPAAGTGRGNRRFTPGEWERRRGVKLRFVDPLSPKEAETMTNNPSEGTNPACLQNAKEAAVTLYGIIRAAGTANLEIHSEIDPVASDLVRYAVDGLLKAASILAKNHADSLDRLDLPGVEQ